MKIYIITYKECGLVRGEFGIKILDNVPRIYKIFINKEDAEKSMNEAKKTFGWRRCLWAIEEREAE